MFHLHVDIHDAMSCRHQQEAADSSSSLYTCSSRLCSPAKAKYKQKDKKQTKRQKNKQTHVTERSQPCTTRAAHSPPHPTTHPSDGNVPGVINRQCRYCCRRRCHCGRGEAPLFHVHGGQTVEDNTHIRPYCPAASTKRTRASLSLGR